MLTSATCASIEPIYIDWRGGNVVRVDGELLTTDDETAFAVADGFESFEALADWLEKTHGDSPFTGWLIKWRVSPFHG